MTIKSGKTFYLAWILCGVISILSIAGMAYQFQTRQEPVPELMTLVSETQWNLLPVGFALLAALIISRQPRNLIGWLLMLPAVAVNDGTLGTYFASFTSAPSNPSVVFLFALSYYSSSWLLLIFPVFLIMLLFPTGQPISARWRWATYYVLGVCIYFFIVMVFTNPIQPVNADLSVRNPIGFIPAEWFAKYLWATFAFGLLSTTILAVTSMVVRYRRASFVEREQMKWLLYACGVFAAVYFIAILQSVENQAWGLPTIFTLLLPLALLSIPTAIAIAILRYRLWDIDIIIRRTLVYASLTAVLSFVFFGGVTLLQQFINPLFGIEDSPIAIVLSTLAIAVLFNPLRLRIQNGIDRRFYRKKYNTEQALARFAARAREETDVEQLSAELVAVVEQAMQPENVALWLKPQQRNR